MKKYINNKVYNTEVATFLKSHDNNRSYSDFSYCCESLYRKKTGEYFLHGEGGPMTRYAVSYGDNEWGGGEEIIPLTFEQAEKWAQENLGAEDYDDIFGEIKEDETRVSLTVMISASTDEKMRRNASKKGLLLSAYLEQLIENDNA